MRNALTLLAAVLLGCAHAPGAASRAASGAAVAELFPLAVGSSWTWLDRSPALAAGRTPERTVRIVSRGPDGFFRDSDGNELRVEGGCLRDRVRRLICAPLERGHAWVSVTGVSATERYEIAAVGERVETPAGTFAGCVRVRSHLRAGAQAENVLELTYAPGVGPVRLETFAVVEGKASLQISAILKSYTPAR